MLCISQVVDFICLECMIGLEAAYKLKQASDVVNADHRQVLKKFQSRPKSSGKICMKSKQTVKKINPHSARDKKP